MKKLFTFFLLATLSVVSVFAETDNNYYWYYNKVKSAPTGKGVIYASTSSDQAPGEGDYKDEVEVMAKEFGMSFSTIYTWAKPAEGYQFVGWYDSDDYSASSLLSTTKDMAILNVGTSYSSESDEIDGYPFEPENVITGLFAKVKASVADGLASAGSVALSKYDNDKGDDLEITATPSKEWAKFSYWLDSKGNKYAENPLKIKVNDMESYTAYFEGDSILSIDFGEGKYVAFSHGGSTSLPEGVTCYYIKDIPKAFYADEGYIEWDESQNAWGYTDTQYDDDGNVISSKFVEYKGEVPSFDSSYELSQFSYNYSGTTGCVLYAEGVKYFTMEYDEYASSLGMLTPTMDTEIDLSTLPEADEDNNPYSYYVFDGKNFVKWTKGSATVSGIVPANSCYLVLDSSQYPLPDTINVADSEIATGIENVASDAMAKGIFTIGGKKVAAPVKGINIIDGKKVFVTK